jgi:hypothetical protein
VHDYVTHAPTADAPYAANDDTFTACLSVHHTAIDPQHASLPVYHAVQHAPSTHGDAFIEPHDVNAWIYEQKGGTKIILVVDLTAGAHSASANAHEHNPRPDHRGRYYFMQCIF